MGTNTGYLKGIAGKLTSDDIPSTDTALLKKIYENMGSGGGGGGGEGCCDEIDDIKSDITEIEGNVTQNTNDIIALQAGGGADVPTGQLPLTAIEGNGSEDLNDVVIPGFYYIQHNDDTSLDHNYPVELAGNLEVRLSSAGVSQTYTTYHGRNFIEHTVSGFESLA